MNCEKLLITEYRNGLLSVLLDGSGKASEIEFTPADAENESIIGNIYVGNVQNIAANVNAAFVKFNGEETGFMDLRENEPLFINETRSPGPLRQGDLILVQAVRDAQRGKLPTLTGRITIPGKYAVLAGGMDTVRISSRIKDKEVCEGLRSAFDAECGKEHGFIIRSEGAVAGISAISREIDILSRKWDEILACARKMRAGLIYSAPVNPVSLIIEKGAWIDGIVTDKKDIYNRLLETFAEYPEITCKLSLYEDRKVPLSVVYNIEREIEQALSKHVNLRSGGFLVIEPTEALVSIDVNSGKNVSGRNSEREAFELNIEAASEAARQIRLRNLSGIIIIDFVNMKEKQHYDELISYLKAEISNDSCDTVFVSVTKLGLAELTRKKVKRPLYEVMTF